MKRKEKARRLKTDIIGAIERNPGIDCDRLAKEIGESRGNINMNATTIASQVLNKLRKHKKIQMVKGKHGSYLWYLPSQLRGGGIVIETERGNAGSASASKRVTVSSTNKKAEKYSFEELMEYLNGFYAYHTEELTKRAGKAEGEAIYWEETAKKYKAQLDQKEAKSLLSWMK
jgi:hypothetical protein